MTPGGFAGGSVGRLRPASGAGAPVEARTAPASGPVPAPPSGPGPGLEAGRGSRTGGIERYPLDGLYEEVAFVAYHFGWSRGDVLALPHWERRRWCEEISRINERVNAGGGDGPRGRVDLGSL